MNTVETLEHRGVTVQIIQDEDPQSPQEFDDSGLFIVAGHRDFYVPEPGEKRVRDWESIKSDYEKTHWIFPIEAYIHSGVRLSLAHQGNFPDRQWDVSQVGAVFASKKEWRLRASALKAAVCLIGEWNKYLSGDVYGYVIEGLGGDSCWGFYGIEYAREQAKEAADHTANVREREAQEAHRWACADTQTVAA